MTNSRLFTMGCPTRLLDRVSHPPAIVGNMNFYLFIVFFFLPLVSEVLRHINVGGDGGSSIIGRGETKESSDPPPSACLR